MIAVGLNEISPMLMDRFCFVFILVLSNMRFRMTNELYYVLMRIFADIFLTNWTVGISFCESNHNHMLTCMFSGNCANKSLLIGIVKSIIKMVFKLPHAFDQLFSLISVSRKGMLMFSLIGVLFELFYVSHASYWANPLLRANLNLSFYTFSI